MKGKKYILQNTFFPKCAQIKINDKLYFNDSEHGIVRGGGLIFIYKDQIILQREKRNEVKGEYSCIDFGGVVDNLDYHILHTAFREFFEECWDKCSNPTRHIESTLQYMKRKKTNLSVHGEKYLVFLIILRDDSEFEFFFPPSLFPNRGISYNNLNNENKSKSIVEIKSKYDILKSDSIFNGKNYIIKIPRSLIYEFSINRRIFLPSILQYYCYWRQHYFYWRQHWRKT
jgi:hypothetical protein